MIQLALFEPEIPQNVGTILRLASCWNLTIHIIEPCGFLWNNKYLKRSAMDYLKSVSLIRHDSWNSFIHCVRKEEKRLVFLDVNGEKTYIEFSFTSNDILVTGREGNGFSGLDYPVLKNSVHIPISTNCRSLNVAMAVGIVTGEALRQTKSLPL